MTTVDARGYSCPEPVIMLRKAMAKKDAEYTVLVDNAASKENVTRYAEHEGYSVTVSESGGEYTRSFPISARSAIKSSASRRATRQRPCRCRARFPAPAEPACAARAATSRPPAFARRRSTGLPRCATAAMCSSTPARRLEHGNGCKTDKACLLRGLRGKGRRGNARQNAGGLPHAHRPAADRRLRQERRRKRLCRQ